MIPRRICFNTMKTHRIPQPATRSVTCIGLALAAVALASCVEVGVGGPYRYGRGGFGGVEVVAPGTHVTVGAPGYVQVLPVGARPIVYRGEQCWFYGGRHYRRHGRGYVVFVP